MFLSAAAIESARKSGLSIEPFSADRLRPASYVLHLNARFRRWRRLAEPKALWRPVTEDELQPIECAERLTVEPQGFVLATTIERLGLPAHLAGQLSPLSHVARFGLSIHCGADWINPGFGMNTPTQLTLEIVNHSPSALTLDAGMPLCHLRLAAVMDAPAYQGMRSVYEARDPLAAPQFFEEMQHQSRPEFERTA